MPSKESIKALRTLLLPISPTPGTESRSASVLEEFLLSLGLHNADFHDWTIINLEQWEDALSPSDELRRAVERILVVSGDIGANELSQHYFSIHKKLIDDHFFSHSEGRWFLSHSFLMLELASKEKLTAAQIARMLAVRDGRARFNRQTTETFLNKMRYGPTLSVEQVQDLFHADSAEEAPFFADASLEQAASMVGSAASALGYAQSLAENLRQLAPEDNCDKYAPYLQILHFQCTLAEYFDHAVTDLYEFSPRGMAALWLFDAYPDALTKAGNPFLNNAKSVERADAGWVRMKKKGERPGTAALEGILFNLEMMGFAARRELARLIRLWLHRIIRFTRPTTNDLPQSLSKTEWEKVIGAVGAGNSSTYGILEQRIVDAITWGQFADGWRARGVGASVNATNISTRRLGDCDYQSSDGKIISAFESHGGVLTDIYVKEHLRTLMKTFALRREELEGIAEISEWEININFVAHSLALRGYADGDQVEHEGAIFTLHFITFSDFVNSWLRDAPNYEHLDQFVVMPLQKKQTPNEVRQKLMALAAPAV
ncbi:MULTISPECIES: hypothetical protein [unclassified Pseudomonas]